jgi:hypothetical protein
MMFCNEAILDCLKNRNRRWLYLTHSNALCKEFFQALADHPAMQPVIAYTYRKDGTYEIGFVTGSKVIFRNWQILPRLRGFKFHHCWIDEIQDFQADAYDSIISPMIRDYRGRVTMTGQYAEWVFDRFYKPGQSPWLLDRYGKPKLDESGQPIPNDLYGSWRIPSSEGLIFQGRIGRQELELAREVTPPNVWDVEYEVKLGAKKNAVFADEDVSACTLDKDPPAGPDPKLNYILAVDTARNIDHTAYVVLETETGLICAAGMFEKKLSWPAIGIRLADVWRKWGQPTTVYDVTGVMGAAGGKDRGKENPIAPHWRQHISNLREFTFSSAMKPKVVTHLGIVLREKWTSIPQRFTEVLRQLRAYAYRTTQTGYVTYSAPKGDHDDYVSALCMAHWLKHMGQYDRKGGQKFTGNF